MDDFLQVLKQVIQTGRRHGPNRPYDPASNDAVNSTCLKNANIAHFG